MNNASFVAAELATSTAVSATIATAINLEPLWTVLISFAVSLVSIAGGELVKYIAAYFQKKREDLDKGDDDGSSN